MINEIINYARNLKCSDIHLTEGEGIVFRLNGKLIIDKNFTAYSEIIPQIIKSILTKEQLEQVDKREDVDCCYTAKNGERQRVNVYYHQGKICAAIRLLNNEVPSITSLGLPDTFRDLADMPNGLILVTGPTGSGKSTTLAAMINRINTNKRCHILTIEDPVEYVHKNKNSLIHQREIGSDAKTFSGALRSALREDPDVILVGEMRDLETISAVVTAAETGHLVLSTLHTAGAANTIDRIIDIFPERDKVQMRTQLASILRGVITQQLVPTMDGEDRCPAFEILLANDAVRTLIRENKCFQIPALLQTNIAEGMCSMDYDLARLVRTGKVSMQEAVERAHDKDQFLRFMQ